MSSKQKIPCSVSLLTLNSAGGLRACLESLKEFQEIIVCDGNSTDGTADIAREFGARVIKQYDTDEPSTPCAMDKAAMRERAMGESTLPWRFFMDADDTLSPEAVEEIRSIVSAAQPAALVWRMPTRIFIADKEIKHEATYPSYQMRLVHERVGARFKGHVHDRLAFDAREFPVGTMRSYYNFNWPPERVANFWRYMKGYADRELKTLELSGVGQFLYWGVYRRVRTLLGYVLWRLPAMYLRWGFKDSMPLRYELTIVHYHWYLLWGTMRHYLATRFWAVVLVETLRGKDLNRILCNVASKKFEAYGRVLDVGGREGGSSYWRYLQTRRWHKRATVDIDPTSKPDVVIDLEQNTLPFADGHFDTALMFNLIEHIGAREQVLGRVVRVLKSGGSLVGVVPFLVGVHPDPHDFVRLTREGLQALFERAGFADVHIEPVGRGPLVASYYQSEFLWPRVLKLIIIPLVLGLDGIILSLRPAWREKFPLSYAFRARA